MQNRRPTLSAANVETVATTAARGAAVAHIHCRLHGQCHRLTAIGDKVAATVARGVGDGRNRRRLDVQCPRGARR